MAKVEHSEVRKSDGRRQYRIKYIEDDGSVKIVTRDIPDEIEFTSTISDLVKNLILWLIIALTLLAVFNAFSSKSDYVNSETLKSSIVTVVNNGAGLDVVKKIYDNRNPLEKGIFHLFDKKVPEYPFDVPLSNVLEDIKADLYIGEEAPDLKTVESINNLIFKHSQKNPFDKLTKQQKDYFENVRQKSGDLYQVIQNDMNNISDELYSKNILVETYLSDSRTSLYVSIFSLLFALIVSSYQIYQGRPKKLADNLKTIVEGIFSKNGSEADCDNDK